MQVLEIGCGVGLGGICAKTYGNAQRVEMVDDDEKLVKVVAKNICDNICFSTHFSLARFTDIQYPHYDTIIALDCIYKGNEKNVANAIVNGLKRKGNAIIINPNRTGVDTFLYMLMESGEVISETIKVRYGDDVMELGLYIFTKTN